MKVIELARDSKGQLPAYAWPGGYPIYYLTKQNDVLCPQCASKSPDAYTGDVHWEGDPLQCEDCNKQIESAYGNPEEDK